MQIEPLSLAHHITLSEQFQQMHLFLSEYSFSNLYLFRELHRYEVIALNDQLFIKGITRDNMPYIMLTEHPSSNYLRNLKIVQENTGIDHLYPIPEHYLPYFEHNLIQASFRESDSDYLFTHEKLAAYPGRDLSKKRNLVKQFLTIHKAASEKISLDNIEKAKEVLIKWVKGSQEDENTTDYQACLEAFESFSLLKLEGRIIYADGIPIGFILGEWLNKECFVIHFEKALRDIKGGYQYVLQDLAGSLENSSCWINMEQDLGIPGLRKAKHSYIPDKMLLKWRLHVTVS